MYKNLKTRVKNDLWKWNYILPFVKKHQFDEKGKIDVIKHIFKAYKEIHLVKAKNERTVGYDTKALLENIEIKLNTENRFVYFLDTSKTIAVSGNILSNFTLDYGKIIHGTFRELERKAEGNDEYGRETKAVAEGIHILISRIIRKLAVSDLKESIKKKRMNEFEDMLVKPAEHFEEALQRILFFNQIMWQTRHRLNGLGRLDQMLGGFYEFDIKNGILTKEEAGECIRDFLKQLSRYQQYKSDALEGDIGQIIVLGGLMPDGKYFSNDLTRIFLREQARLGKPDPKTLLRVSKNMPEDILELAVECIEAKTGSPLFSNDDRVIPSLIQFGAGEDAYSYCTSACWEPYIVGKSLDQNNIAVFDFFTALDEILDKEEIDDFNTLVECYIQQNQRNFKMFLSTLDQLKWAKDPLVSMFMEGCSENRKDVSEGATVYNNYGITTVALSNTVDSLFNIKKFVFDEKKYMLKELNMWRNEDFKGKQELVRELQEGRRFYGHDEPEVIQLVERITSNVAESAQKYRNVFGGTVKLGLSSPGYNILSKKAKADFAGRMKGMPYNTHISCMDATYTEVVNFASQLSYGNQRFNGNVVDFFAAPDFIKRNKEKFILFMQAAIQVGFFQMQMNVMDSGTLIDAKEHPEKYTGLIVRVWGFSAYFNDLPESYKDLLIQRALAAEKTV